MQDKQSLLRRLPAVDVVLKADEVRLLLERYGHATLLKCLRQLIDGWRGEILTGRLQAEELEQALAGIAEKLELALRQVSRPNLRPVINATGIVIHTNLGRSLLPEKAKEQIASVASAYSTLEVDVETGDRGSRYSHVVELLQQLTGAEDALVVNNNAGAVLLALAGLTAGREVVVSRGQLVEIGGSFRIPEVMEQGGSKLVEVGTTNKTHLFDYERVIGSETAALLKVHTSNYRVIGFTEEVSGQAMAELAHAHGLLAIEDLGSGVLIDLAKLGLPYEPTVQECLASGMDVVTFSGDKLLGGPQAGIIVGNRDCIAKLRKHPLTRALRIDKLTLAALEATLRLYTDEAIAIKEIPTLRMLAATVSELRSRGAAFLTNLTHELGHLASFELVDSLAQVGGGSLPGVEFPSVAIGINPVRLSSNQLEEALRLADNAVFARIYRDRVLLDLRTLQPGEEKAVQESLAQALGGRV